MLGEKKYDMPVSVGRESSETNKQNQSDNTTAHEMSSNMFIRRKAQRMCAIFGILSSVLEKMVSLTVSQ